LKRRDRSLSRSLPGRIDRCLDRNRLHSDCRATLPSRLLTGRPSTVEGEQRLAEGDVVARFDLILAPAKTPMEEPAGVEASFEFRAAFNATATRMMTAVPRNDQAAAVYA
jgi:hypothetical protein